MRLLPIILTAFLISAAFGIASIFSSNVTNETLNQVLLKGTRCGTLDQDKGSLLQQLMVLQPWVADLASKYLNYGSQCYTNATSTDGCNLYIKPRLPLMSTRGIDCPFGEGICKSDNDNLRMDTGYLDSLEDLGINTEPRYRFQLRFVHTCAPIKTQGYTQDIVDPEYGDVKRYLYGTAQNPRTVLNYTYEVPKNNAFLPDDNSSSADIPRL